MSCKRRWWGKTQGCTAGTWEYPLQTPQAPGSPTLSSHGSYLSYQPSSPGAASALANAPSQSLTDDPNTPAGASTTSFESIDLSGSPVKRPSRAAAGSPEFLTPMQNGGHALSAGTDPPAVDHSGDTAPLHLSWCTTNCLGLLRVFGPSEEA